MSYNVSGVKITFEAASECYLDRKNAGAKSLSFFSFIRSLLVSEVKTRGFFHDVDRLCRCRVVVVLFECHNDTHSSHIIARTAHCFAFLLPVPPSRFSVIVAVVGERLAAQVYFRIAYLYAREDCRSW